MTHATRYPGADQTTQWRGAGGVTMTTVNKLLLHTTESTGWPSYPSFAPTLTFNPWKPRGQRWRQHYPINGSATTLANAGTHRTNRDNVCQIEIVAYCDPAKLSSSAHISNLGTDAYQELGEFLAWIHEEWEVPLTLAPSWKPYPSSYGIDNGVRFTVAQFVSFQGVCGHQHAPQQSHGDPGTLDVDAILAEARPYVATTPYPTPKTTDVYLSKLKFGQTDSDSVWLLQNALREDGYDVPLSGTYDKVTAAAVARCVFDGGDEGVTIHNDL